MCPFCLATAALIAGGAAGTTGLSVFVVTKILKRSPREKAELSTAAKEL